MQHLIEEAGSMSGLFLFLLLVVYQYFI